MNIPRNLIRVIDHDEEGEKDKSNVFTMERMKRRIRGELLLHEHTGTHRHTHGEKG